MNIFERNMAAFEKREGCSAEELRKYNLDEINDVGIEYSTNGNKILYKIYQGRKWRLNSSWNPQKAAEYYAERYQIQLYGTYFVFGFSDGSYIRELARKCDDTNQIVVCIPDIILFSAACYHFELQDILENSQIIFCFLEQKKSAETFVGQILNYSKIKLVEFCILPGYDIIYHEECEAFMNDVLECVKNEIVSKETHLAFERKLPQNMLYHMKHMLAHSNMNQLKKQLKEYDLKEIPVIIVSAGPSLDKNIHLLRQAEGKAFIIALDASVRAVLQAGVKPNLLCSVDPNSPEKFFSNLDLKDIIWACNSWTNAKLLESYHVEQILYYGSYGPIWNDILEETLGYKFPNITSGGSVSTEALMLAIGLGFQKIVFIGQDLAFTGGVSHTKGIEGALGDNDEYIKSRQIVKVKGMDGTMLETDYQMYLYKEWIEKAICYHKDQIRIIDATEGGAQIEGAETQTLEEVIKSECNQKFDIYEKEKNISAMFSPKQQKELHKRLKDIGKNIINFMETVEGTIREQEKIYAEMQQKEIGFAKKQELLRRTTELNHKLEEESILEYIIMYAQKEEYEIGDTIYTEKDLTPEQLVKKSLALLKGYQNGAKLFLEDFDAIIMQES